jgi:hypothetical protein
VLGEEHQSALTSMSNLGLMLTYEGKYNAFGGRLQRLNFSKRHALADSGVDLIH